MCSRYYTATELERKRDQAGESGDNFIVPYMQEYLTLEEGEGLHEKSERLQNEALNMQMSIPLQEEDMIKIGGKDLYVVFDEISGNIHIRRYWMSRDGQMKPHKRGVCMSAEEFTNLLLSMDDMLH